MNPAPNLVLVGPMGAGKSSIGRRLAERFGLTFVDADHVVEQRTGASINTIFEHVGEAGFRERERLAIAELMAGEGLLVSTGGGAVIDPASRELMRARGYVVYLQVGLASQLRRLGRDRTRPLLLRGDREQVLRDLATSREPYYRDVADHLLDTDGLSAHAATTQLIEGLARRWQRGVAGADAGSNAGALASASASTNVAAGTIREGDDGFDLPSARPGAAP